jgi:glucokinase
MILAGDIGGTKTLLALVSPDDHGTLSGEGTYRSQGYGGLEDVVEEFLKDRKERIKTACFAVAGPVRDNRCETTNLPWVVDSRRLESRFGISSVALLNDLEATAYGALFLSEEDLFVLNAGRGNPTGSRAVIAAGTGLGDAILIWDGAKYIPVASEGGHSDFGPRKPVEVRLLEHLEQRYGHVSYERILSGPGLMNIYRFLIDSGLGSEPDWLAARMKSEDPGSVISGTALAGEAEISVKALELFVSIYGAEAGNLALKTFSTGGVYVGGGIAPKILPRLKDGTFMKAFTDKGRYDSYLSDVPVRVILNPKTALLGASRFALTRRTEGR